ncbi:MAG: hypothetical protein ACRDPK_20710, partial [Carbonactinosporaceae bacterium]
MRGSSADPSRQDPGATAAEVCAARAHVIAVVLEEFQALRQEINTRQNILFAIVAADLTALATGFALAAENASALAGIAYVSSLLWLFWLAQVMQIYRAAAYIALDLRATLVRELGTPMLGWEGFVHKVTRSRSAATRELNRLAHSERACPESRGTWVTIRGEHYAAAPTVSVLGAASGWACRCRAAT